MLPVNIPQIYGIPSFDGLNALMTSAYLKRTTLGMSEALRRGRRGQGSAGSSVVGDIMAVRYLVAPAFEPSFVASPVIETAARSGHLGTSVGLFDIGGSSRLSIRQAVGRLDALDMRLPECEALDFRVGLTSDRARAANSVAFELSLESPSGRRIDFRENLDIGEDGGRWHRFRLGVADLAGSQVTLSLGTRVIPGADRAPIEVAWADFDFVTGNCDIVRRPAEFEIRPGKAGGILSFEVEAACDDLPLTLVYGNGTVTEHRWVRLVPAGRRVRLLTDTRAAAPGPVIVRSDVAFDLKDAKLVYSEHPEALHLDLIYDGDMCLYENSYCLPRGVCLDKALLAAFPGVVSRDGELRLAAAAEHLRRYVCGSCEITGFAHEEVVLEVATDRAAILLFQETSYPGWEASVDGKAAHLVRTDLGFGALELAPGRHVVVMRFRPWSVRAGLGLTCLGIILTLVYAKKAKSKETD